MAGNRAQPADNTPGDEQVATGNINSDNKQSEGQATTHVKNDNESPDEDSTAIKEIEDSPAQKEQEEGQLKPDQILTHTFNDVKTLKVGEERQSKSVIFVSNLPWTISIQRVKQPEGKTSLGFYVSCNKGDKSTWSCEAVVEQRLLPVLKDMRVKAKRGSIDVYRRASSEMGYPNFLDWDDLVDVNKGYMSSDGKATFQISVDVKSVQQNSNDELSEPKQTLTHTFKNVNEMAIGENRMSKSVMYINEKPWKIIIMRLKQENDQTTLGLIASCNKDDKTDWSCHAQVEYRVLPVNSRMEVKSWTGGIDEYSKSNPNYGVPDIFTWNEAMNESSGFVSKRGDMTFQIVVETIRR